MATSDTDWFKHPPDHMKNEMGACDNARPFDVMVNIKVLINFIHISFKKKTTEKQTNCIHTFPPLPMYTKYNL